MIAKKSARRRDCQSSFKTLAAYILRGITKDEPAPHVRLTNCGFDQAWAAIKEIEAAQALNTTSRADKTYHLIVSFRTEDNPTPEQLADCEEELCRALGYDEHQRISAVHTDTEHVHMHVAINKVHPDTLRNVTPLKDFYKLDEACRILERRHGLSQDNRIDRSQRQEKGQGPQAVSVKAREMEAHGGLVSFENWIRGEPKSALTAALETAPTWHSLHARLARFDLEIRPRGAGLVIKTRRGNESIKASALGRQFSMTALQERIGPYEFPRHSTRRQRPHTAYHVQPVHVGAKTSPLWASWQAEREEYDKARTKIDDLREQRGKWKEEKRQAYQRQRARVLADPLLGWRQKRQLCDALRQRRLVESQQAYRQHQAAVHDVYRQHRARGWQTYLIDEATAGNVEALKMLKARAAKGKGLSLLQDAAPKPAPRKALGAFVGRLHAAHVFPRMAPKVLKTGEVIYDLQGARLRDTGGRLYLEADRKDGVAAALRMARTKYGDRLSIEGDEVFKRAVVETAARHDMAVTFADPDLERRRKVLTATLTHRPPQSRQPNQAGRQVPDRLER